MPLESQHTGSLVDRVEAVGFDYDGAAKRSIEECNLCGSTSFRLIADRDRYHFHVGAVMCDQCSLVFLDPRMTSTAYTVFYRDYYRSLVSAFHGRQIDAETIQEGQQAYGREMVTLARPYVNFLRGGNLLDIGGSTGIVAACFSDAFDLHATILDPAPDEIKVADSLGIKTITSLVEDWDPNGKTYEMIGLFQTIDHLLDVSATLEKVREVIAPNGVFLVDIVDFDYVRQITGSLNAALKIDHPFYLTKVTAEAFLLRAGFEPILCAHGSSGKLVTYICKPTKKDPNALPSMSKDRDSA